MIVRISSEDQYRIDDDRRDELNELDNAVVAAVDAGDESGFNDRFGALLTYVRQNGESLADDELVESHVILPPDDLSFAEAQTEFTGEGLIPD